jgi:hypothetical protein
MKRHFALCLLAVTLPAVAAAQTVNYFKFTPSVLPAGTSQPVLYEIELAGTPATRVTLEYQPQGSVTVIELRDDGTGGDQRAGDAIWTAQVPSAPILAGRRADDVHRVFVGFVNIFNGATNVMRGNMFISVYTADLGTPGITRLGQFVQATPRVVNIHDAGFFVNREPTRITREFYRWFGDDYDVLNLVYEPPRFSNRTHSVVKNDVQGIGLQLVNNTSLFGSAGRLQGISQFPIGTFFDGAETGHIHELGHQWVNFLNFQPLTPGIPHWPLSSMAGGVMGFSIGGQGGQGGSFRCDVREENGQVVLGSRPDAPAYNDFDLYLMGLLPAGEVRPQLVFADQAAAQTLQCNGQTFTGAVTRITVDDIINRFGPRRPATTPSQIRIATVYVTRDELATPEEMWLYTYFAGRGELRERTLTHSGFLKELGRPFYLATGGRATLDMSVTLAGADFVLVPTPSSRTVPAGTPASFSISAMPQGGSFDGAVRFSCGALPTNASCSFSPQEVTPGTTGRDTVLTIATRSGSAEMGSSTAGTLVASVGLAVATALTRPRRGRRDSRLEIRAARRPRHWLVVAALVVLPSCGTGGGNGGKNPPPTGSPNTPAGTYQIVVNGTSDGSLRSTTVTLVVQ